MRTTQRQREHQPLVEIRLYGHLRARFGKSYRLAVKSSREAVRALCTVVPGFKAYMCERSQPGYRIWSGKDPIKQADELLNPCGNLVRIVPAVAGAKRGGLGEVFLGAALIGLAIAFPGVGAFAGTSLSQIGMSLGVSMVLGGISQMLAGSPQSSAPAERPDNQPSYSFNGAVNTTGQGNPVPIGYGRMRIGSQVISTGLSVAPL